MATSARIGGRLNGFIWAVLLVVVFAPAARAGGHSARGWGLGWEDGLTVRRWLGTRWELGLAAGPDDYLVKAETRTWYLAEPAVQQGVLQVPVDNREEHGWVRGQVGYLITQPGDLSLVGYSGLVYGWTDYQERALILDPLVGEYDSWEADRFAEQWVLTVGVRPAWRPADFMTVEFAMGLNFIWESWDQTSERTRAGVEGSDRTVDSGHSRSFADFGWVGAGSLQFFFWF